MQRPDYLLARICRTTSASKSVNERVAMSKDDDDEFGESGWDSDEELVWAAGQAITKRRRLNDGRTSDRPQWAATEVEGRRGAETPNGRLSCTKAITRRLDRFSHGDPQSLSSSGEETSDPPQNVSGDGRDTGVHNQNAADSGNANPGLKTPLQLPSSLAGGLTRSFSKRTLMRKPADSRFMRENMNCQRTSTAPPADINVLDELEGLPSDAFSLSSSIEKPQDEPVLISSHTSASALRPRPTLSGGNLRQTTLFGVNTPTSACSTQRGRSNVKAKARADEPLTQHKLNQDALKTWVYPTNLGTVRDYQYNIVQQGLYHNLLVALPTGLGKTFIAATIMLNWFRWTTQSQIVFVAPTKPLVAQQVDACFRTVGIPRSETTMLTGATPPGLRAEEWSNKRVFFMTPQTMINDLKAGICNPKRIVCVVVDEAHRATGAYSYVGVIQFIRRFNQSFRVLALTATPGSSVEAVQEVVDGLDISRVEIRTEESLDIRQYVHSRKVETVLFDPSEEICTMRTLFAKALQPILDQLNQVHAYWVRDPMSLTAWGLTQARRQWMGSDAGSRAGPKLKGKMHAIFALLASLAHSITLLNFHGIGPFYHYLVSFRSEVESGGSRSKYRKQLLECSHFQSLMAQARQWVSDSDFIGHPKLVYLRQAVLNHFLDAGEGRSGSEGIPPSATRIMIFAQYRDSAEEIARVLRRNEPMIRPHVFVGQAMAKGSVGMNQKTQLEVIQKFQKGIYNTLVATCVGEEGLDIGEVDLIVCCDSSTSPIRMLQRMGRTGRKRAGNIVLLLMRGKEEESYVKAKDAYEKMQQMIASGTRFTFHDELSPRILPTGVHPVVDKRIIEIPFENSQRDLPEPKRRGKIPKRPPKKFHMPDGVRTGFVRASRLRNGEDGESSDDCNETPSHPEALEEEIIPIPAIENVLLSAAEERELNRRYQYVYGSDGAQTISTPRLDAQPGAQRSARGTKHIPHGRSSMRMVAMLNAVHNMDKDTVDRLETSLHPDDRELAISCRRKSVGSAEVHSEGRKSRYREAGRPAAASLSQSQDSLSGESSSQEAGTEGEMDDFIVSDGAEEMAPSSSTSSPPSLGPTMRPFYTSPKSSLSGSLDAEEELPDLNILVGKKSDVAISSATRHPSSGDVVRKTAKRRKRRPVVDDSDE